MKTYSHIHKIVTLLLVVLVIVSCERGLSDDVDFASFPTNGDIFLDNPVGITDEFFESFDPSEGYDTESFDVVNDEAFEGTSSIRLDVPAPTPSAFQVGGIFRDRGDGRNLTGYDALTFYAKASTTGGTINIGFGSDFGEGKFSTDRQGIELTTNWQKYTVPLPDPSRLIQERGLFSFFGGPIIITDNDGNAIEELGWTFWLDEIRFENLGTVAQPRPRIFSGQDFTLDGFTGTTIPILGLTQTYSTANEGDVTTVAAPAYYDFISSNPDVAIVNELGEISVIGEGTTTITAQLNGVLAQGSLELTSVGPFQAAPVPTRPASDVISIFSDAYTNIQVDYYNGFFIPDGQTTLGGAFPVGSDESIISYTELNFVGIGFFDSVPSVNATNMTHVHLDINVQEAIDGGDFIRLQLLNSVGNNESSGSYTINGNELQSQQWVGFDIPLSDFAGLSDRSQLGLFFFISDSTISNIFVDNIYFYRE